MTFVLHAHLSPVQGFIAEARRTRDWWAGSFLLSWLVAQAITAAVREGSKPSQRLSFNSVFPVVAQDPMLAALSSKDGIGPVLGTLPNHFEITGVDQNAGQAAERAVLDAWRRLAMTVWEYLMAPALIESPHRAQIERRFKAQVGIDLGVGDPLWDMTWVMVRTDKKGNADPHALLEARRRDRYRPGKQVPSAAGDAETMCAMMPGFAEISGLRGLSERAAVVQALRGHLVRLRTGREPDPDTCLDLRAGEALSAPALVKRLFPLLALVDDGRPMSAAIGWKPANFGWQVDPGLDGQRPGFLEFISSLFRPSTRQASGPSLKAAQGLGVKMEPLVWPSTSTIAAAPWLAQVLGADARLAHKDREELATVRKEVLECIKSASPLHAVAERHLWIRSLSEAIGEDISKAKLSQCDGSTFFEGAGADLTGDAASPKAKRLENALNALADISVRLPDGIQRVAARNGNLRLGRPSPYYAVIRADGDNMGRAFASSKNPRQLSQMLANFAGSLSIVTDSTGTPNLGAIIKRDGVIMYAGADDALCLCPVESAIPIAAAIREAFATAITNIAFNAGAQPTISVAVTFVHRRVPLNWTIASSEALLRRIAKENVGRNALAIELLETGGRVTEWAQVWEADLIQQHWALVADAVRSWPFLGSNNFLHDAVERLAPFGFRQHVTTVSERLAELRDNRWPNQPVPADRDLTIALLAEVAGRHARFDRGDRLTPAEHDDIRTICERLVDLMLVSWRDKAGQLTKESGPLVLEALSIVRFLSREWRRLDDDLFVELPQ